MSLSHINEVLSSMVSSAETTNTVAAAFLALLSMEDAISFDLNGIDFEANENAVKKGIVFI